MRQTEKNVLWQIWVPKQLDKSMKKKIKKEGQFNKSYLMRELVIKWLKE